MSAPPCVSFHVMKNGRPRPTSFSAQRYTPDASKAVQPPDDRTYSAEVTAFRRNLPHHRSARAVFPYTRSNTIPFEFPFVKKKFRKNHKLSRKNSLNVEKSKFHFCCRFHAKKQPEKNFSSCRLFQFPELDLAGFFIQAQVAVVPGFLNLPGLHRCPDRAFRFPAVGAVVKPAGAQVFPKIRKCIL